MEEWKGAGWLVSLAAGSDGEIERFQELATEEHFDVSGRDVSAAPITRGFVFPAARLAVLSDAELFGRSSSLRQRRLSHRRERMLAGRAAIDFTEFEPGDYVVHLDHGIGRFEGLQMIARRWRGRRSCPRVRGRRPALCAPGSSLASRPLRGRREDDTPNFPSWATDAGRGLEKKPGDPFSTTPLECCACRPNAT